MIHRRAIVVVFVAALAAAALASDLVVERELVGPIRNNVYLIYDRSTREAALIDVAGPIPRLFGVIAEEGLRLEYVFATHAHPDHTFGLSEVRARYPKARLCMSKTEYDDTERYRNWAEVLDPREVAEIRKNPAAVEVLNFDLTKVWPPDVLVEDGQTFALGGTAVRAVLTPGHSRGSISYVAGTAVFTGDLLFNRSVGRTDLGDTGSWDQLVRSVRKLYAALPDSTVVYPGHGAETSIGAERCGNPRVTEDAANPKR